MGLSISVPILFFFFRWLGEGRFNKTENSRKVFKKVNLTDILSILTLLPSLTVRHVREERLGNVKDRR